jgi:hypothetical protein
MPNNIYMRIIGVLLAVIGPQRFSYKIGDPHN